VIEENVGREDFVKQSVILRGTCTRNVPKGGDVEEQVRSKLDSLIQIQFRETPL